MLLETGELYQFIGDDLFSYYPALYFKSFRLKKIIPNDIVLIIDTRIDNDITILFKGGTYILPTIGISKNAFLFKKI